jgi:hypothetical protein
MPDFQDRPREITVPKWLSSLLIVAGFFAIVGLAFMPRILEVHVVIYDQSTNTFGGPGDHGAPAPIAPPEE